MLSDVEMKRLNENVVSIYQEMELDMLNKLGTFLNRNDKIGGTAKWYIKKLEEISNLNGDLVKTVSQYTSKTEEAIRNMLEEACIANFASSNKENEISLNKLKENLPQNITGTADYKTADGNHYYYDFWLDSVDSNNTKYGEPVTVNSTASLKWAKKDMVTSEN